MPPAHRESQSAVELSVPALHFPAALVVAAGAGEVVVATVTGMLVVVCTAVGDVVVSFAVGDVVVLAATEYDGVTQLEATEIQPESVHDALASVPVNEGRADAAAVMGMTVEPTDVTSSGVWLVLSSLMPVLMMIGFLQILLQ